MRALRAALMRIAHLVGLRRHDDDFDAELAAHIELHVEDNIRRGMAPDEARRVALARLGGLQHARQAYLEQAGLPLVEHLAQDVRDAFRSLMRAPAFAAVALVTIALGVAGPTVMFVMTKQWILDPLPFEDPDRLLDLRNADKVSGDVGSLNIADVLDWKRDAKTVADLAAYRRADVRLTGVERAERVRGALVTPNFFTILGVQPAAGRLFASIDAEAGAASVVIISEAMWRRQFQSAGDIVGRTIRLDGTDHTIVGLLRPGFEFTLLGAIDVWRPLRFTPQDATDRRFRSVVALARTADGSTFDAARAELQALGERQSVIYPDTNARRSVRVLTLADEVRLHHDAGIVVPVLFGMMVLVLLVASANVTNVMLARTTTRRQEIAVRLSLGASRARIARQWLVEHVLLFGAASVAATALALYGAGWVTRSIPADNRQFLRNFGELTLEPAALAFAVIGGTGCGAIFGLLPAWKSARADVNIDLKEAAARLSPGRGAARVRAALVVVEMALTLAFLIAAGLLVMTTHNITSVDVGFDARQLVTFQLSLDQTRYRSPSEIRDFYGRLTSSLERVPGVTGVAFGTLVPFGSEGNTAEFFLDGQSDTPRSQTPAVALSEIAPDYVATLRMRLIAGRAVSTDDGAAAPRVAMINDNMVPLFGGRDPIGQRIRLRRDSTESWLVIGVVAGVKNFATIERDQPQVYIPFAQSPRRTATVVLRAPAEAGTIAPAIREAVAAVDPAEPINDLVSMEDRIGRATAPYRIIATFVTFFGAVTLLLAGVGLFGVVSYSFAQRTREIGLRMALGARRLDVAAMVLTQLRTLLVAGVVPGLVLAWILGQAMRALLFGVTPADWRLYAGMTLALAVVSLIAVALPARRATAIDPMVALRYE